MVTLDRQAWTEAREGLFEFMSDRIRDPQLTGERRRQWRRATRPRWGQRLIFGRLVRAAQEDGNDVESAAADGTLLQILIEWIQSIDWDRLFNEILPALLEFIITIIGLFGSPDDSGGGDLGIDLSRPTASGQAGPRTQSQPTLR